MPASMLDQQYYGYLVERIRRGDGEAFTELYTQTYKSMYRYAYYILKDPDLVPDALQEVYIAVYKNLVSLKIDRLVLPWMRQIVYRVCCDMERKQRRTEVTMSQDDLAALDSLTPHSGPDPFQEVYDRDLSAHLQQALAKLPAKERMAFQLRYLQELKLEEVADFMGISLASAKRYIQNARTALQKHLAYLREGSAPGR